MADWNFRYKSVSTIDLKDSLEERFSSLNHNSMNSLRYMSDEADISNDVIHFICSFFL